MQSLSNILLFYIINFKLNTIKTVGQGDIFGRQREHLGSFVVSWISFQILRRVGLRRLADQ